jgi:hypothetical protein
MGIKAFMSRVPLLDVAPGLGVHLCHAELREARGRCLVSVVGLARGKRVPTPDGGYLVIRGMLTRRLDVGDRTGAELLSSGDVIHPTPGESAWRVEQTALLAVLDQSFHRSVAPWPRPRDGAARARRPALALAAAPAGDRRAPADLAARAPRPLARRQPLGKHREARRASRTAAAAS